MFVRFRVFLNVRTIEQDPNKQVVRVYSVPANTFESDDDEDDEEEDQYDQDDEEKH